ncbi:hypothetical protein JTE90_002731 [Oedothorax gibbosus]|uniref:Uncharacterized protein n=1 Tax=Oedothorax gibbosus TaxID=931172 RepID=A0AAV6VZT4_9ARAC|nr:hypothetical protein JTE90_002731 [Oedothorax gibbosus]
MSKREETLKALAYLKQEEAYIANLKKYLSDQMFKLQIEELNFTVLLRQKKMALQQQQMKKENENGHEETLPCTSLQKPMTPSVAPPLTKTDIVPSTSQILEPLNLEPAIAMESDDDD